MKTAIVIGATGLVGAELVKQLLSDDRFDKVKVLVRKATGIKNEKLEEHIVDFDNPDSARDILKGAVLFSAMGTTLSKAGSKKAQYKIDYTYQYNIAKIAAENGVASYVLISAAGAKEQAIIFYSRMKGELEKAVQRLPFQQTHIIRPGALAGR